MIVEPRDDARARRPLADTESAGSRSHVALLERESGGPEAGVIESPEVAGYFAGVFDWDWEIGWDPADVPANLASVFQEAVFEPAAFAEIHPADLV